MTYNILVGGTRGRMTAIEAVIRAHDPDILGVQESNDPDAIRALAARLGMDCIIGYAASGYHVALLSRWPIRAWVHHSRPVFQKTLIEAVIEVPGEPQPWHIFVGHLTAEFSQGLRAERQRVAEVRAILECMELARILGRPHALLGDFNALAPGERFDAVQLLRRVIELDARRAATNDDLHGHPYLTYIIPPPLRPLIPLITRIPTTPWLAGLAAGAAYFALPRLAVPELLRAGYIDCLRRSVAHPWAVPPTCPLPRPAGRIDYIWTDPLLAQRLQACHLATDGPIIDASDHAPVIATFMRAGLTADISAAVNALADVYAE